jgi:hypothetical protein
MTNYDLFLDRISYERNTEYTNSDVTDILMMDSRDELETAVKEFGPETTLGELARTRSRAIKNRLKGNIQEAIRLEDLAERIASEFERHDYDDYSEDADELETIHISILA